MRKHILLAFLSTVGLLIQHDPIGAQSCYELVWSDEFNYSGKPDPNVWTHETGAGGWGNNEWQYYTDRPENARVEDGKLVIEARKEDYEGSSYTSARLITYQSGVSFKYGKIEARIKLPYGQGIWPAFWMLGNGIFEGTPWPGCGEIDILEMIGGGTGRDDVAHGTVHWSDASGNHASYGGSIQLDNGILADDYHTFSITWDASMIRWYMDGIQYHQVSIGVDHMSEFHEEFFILLNLAVGGNWPGYPDASTIFPQKMYVDYVRVYQLDTAPEITGDSLVVPGEKGIVFSTVESEGFIYDWSVPGGAVVTSWKADSSAITVDWACDSGTVRCMLTTGCDTYDLSMKVETRELEIEGKDRVDPFGKGLVFSVPATREAGYDWVLPGGVMLRSEADSNAVVVDWNDIEGKILLRLSDHCGLDTAEFVVGINRQLPYPDPEQPHRIPGTIWPVNYDTGGEGVAYHDFEPENLGPGSRQDEGVDTEPNDGGENIGWLEYGEWLEYTIEVEETGIYDVDIRCGSPNSTGMFTLFFNGEDRTGILNVPQTGSWTAFTTLPVKDIQLNQGDTVMRIFIDNGQFNLGRLTFSPSTTGAETPVPPSDLVLYPSPVRQELHVRGLTAVRNYRIVDISGRMVISGHLQPGTAINVGNLQPGFYCLLLEGEGTVEVAGKFQKIN